jgi:hypothetical protein
MPAWYIPRKPTTLQWQGDLKRLLDPHNEPTARAPPRNRLCPPIPSHIPRPPRFRRRASGSIAPTANPLPHASGNGLRSSSRLSPAAPANDSTAPASQPTPPTTAPAAPIYVPQSMMQEQQFHPSGLYSAERHSGCGHPAGYQHKPIRQHGSRRASRWLEALRTS